MLATQNGNTEIVEVLLKQHADPNITDKVHSIPLSQHSHNN